MYNGAHWESGIVVPLLPYVPGTDSGAIYTSANADTDPQEPIAVIEGLPFANTDPLGTFTIRLKTGDFDDSFIASAMASFANRNGFSGFTVGILIGRRVLQISTIESVLSATHIVSFQYKSSAP